MRATARPQSQSRLPLSKAYPSGPLPLVVAAGQRCLDNPSDQQRQRQQGPASRLLRRKVGVNSSCFISYRGGCKIFASQIEQVKTFLARVRMRAYDGERSMQDLLHLTKGLSPMTLLSSLLNQLENKHLNLSQRAELRCQCAREHEDRGEYEEARQAMGELWQRIGKHPKIEGLKRSTAGEVLLRAGVLTSWIGSKNQVTDAQETAKNLLSESISIFESLNHAEKIAEVKTELSLCYWREGAIDEARVVLQGVLSQCTTESELKAKAVLRSAMIEREATRYSAALRLLTDNAALFETIDNHTLKGSYHNNLANLWENLERSERRTDYIDRALIEFAAASYHFEQAKHKCYRAHVENNLGFLCFKVRRFKEAHEHLDRSRRLFIILKDSGSIAQVDETRARVFLAEGRNADAEKTARASVVALEQGGQLGLLAEALITHGTALARLGYYSPSYATLQHAIEAARASGSLSRAGDAALILMDELGEHLGPRSARTNFTGCALGDIKHYEHDLIKDALLKANGSITHAARLLGTSYQRVSYIIENRHKDLLKARKPKKQRPKKE
jgi:tetratricopeptide (TPR) repeat protein